MQQHFAADWPFKMKFEDLKRVGIVRSRGHLRTLIERGEIRPPHKDGKHHQSAIWWYAADIQEDLAKWRERLSGR